jgi:hypothetical protein
LAKILLWMLASPPTSQNWKKKNTLVGTGLWPKEPDKDSLTAREVAIIVYAHPAQVQTQPQFAHVDLKTGSDGNERRRMRRRSKRVFEVLGTTIWKKWVWVYSAPRACSCCCDVVLVLKLKSLVCLVQTSCHIIGSV